MRRISALIIGGLVVACAGPGERFAQEDLEGVDLKVIVARSGAQNEARALTKSTPYRFELEPLSQVFSRGDALRVWVLGYSLEDLGRAFPSLAGRGAADIVDSLAPGLGAPGPGRYPAPEPQRLLVATIDEGSPADIAYEAGDWAQVEPSLQLHFALAGEVACPPVGAVIRAYSRDDPSRVCLYTRNQACEWSRPDNQACPHQSQIFGSDGALVQQPDGTLRVGDTPCARVAAMDSGEALGETAAFSCDGRVIATQEQPLDARGLPWVPMRGPTITAAGATQNAQWVPVSPGLYFAFESGGQAELRRVGIKGGVSAFETLQHPVVDAPNAGQRRASSADGLRVTLSGGEFEANVGTAAQQCFRRADGSGLPSMWGQITGRAGSALTLAPPALPSFTDVADWQVIGDPGQQFNISPSVTAARLPTDSGGLGTLSARSQTFPADLLVHGRTRTFALNPVTRFAGTQNLVSCPDELSRPADLAGPIIAAPSGYYGMRADGVQVIGLDGGLGPVLSSEGETFSRSWTMTRTRTAADLERVVVYRAGVAHVFDPGSALHHVHQVPGRIVAVLPGPELLYLPDALAFTVAKAAVNGDQLLAAVHYAVPAFEELGAPPLSINPAAVFISGNASCVGFTTGSFAGVLDLKSGLSTAAPIGAEAAVQALFQDDGGTEIWGAVTTAAGTLELLRMPTL